MAHYLTERQKQILDFISTQQEKRGVSPTHREICEHFGYTSYGTVQKHLKLLEKKGYLRRDWNQKRGVEILDHQKGLGKSSNRGLPFLGRIAAGQPIESVSGNETLEVPAHLLGGRHADHYVLRVVGDSMVGEGIEDGDLVVVERREEAAAGEMVVALVGGEATLKRFFPEGDEIRLQPANPAMRPLRARASDVKVQGIVVGLMRRF